MSPLLFRDPRTIFSLFPMSQRAESVAAEKNNDHVSRLDQGIAVIDIGFQIRTQSSSTLATLGRRGADIYVPGADISKIHCSFEIDLNTHVVMLYDRSWANTTHVFGDDSVPFENGRPRRVVMHNRLNTRIAMGVPSRGMIEFKVEWHLNAADVMEYIKSLDIASLAKTDNPRDAPTVGEADTSNQHQLKMRYTYVDLMKLGSGRFGEVHRVVDVDTGKVMAMKLLKRPANASAEEQEEWRRSVYYALKREVETLSRISHPCIVDYITSQGWTGPAAEIFMGLKEGTLQSLIGRQGDLSSPDSLFHQMLQALDCLACNGIIHRDVKPENILYVTLSDGRYQFQLGDFGLCNRTIDAYSRVGSPIFMAPELYQGREQTQKVDIWSLFVTMLWTLNISGFRLSRREFPSADDLHNTISRAASQEPSIARIQEMAAIDPERRASAAQMLVKCFNGMGLSTPRDQVPALPTRPTAEFVEAEVAASSRSGRRSRTGPPLQSSQHRVGRRTQPWRMSRRASGQMSGGQTRRR